MTIGPNPQEATRLLGVDRHPRISHETEERILTVAQALALDVCPGCRRNKGVPPGTPSVGSASCLVSFVPLPRRGASSASTLTRTPASSPASRWHLADHLTYLFDKDGQPVDLSTCTVCPHAELTPGAP